MVTFSQKLTDGMERARISMLWSARIKATGMTYQQFGLKYKIDKGQLSRWVNGINGPRWDAIKKMEKLLKREGV